MLKYTRTCKTDWSRDYSCPSIIGLSGATAVHDTRQTIIDAAVDLFSEVGYANTEIHDILTRAAITKGAFFSHFPTKEAVVSAIIAEADIRTEDVLIGVISSASSALENLIVATLVVTDMTERDALTRIANRLRQSAIDVNPVAGDALSTPSWAFTETALKSAIVEGDLLDDIDIDAMALTIRAAVLGTRLLTDVTAEGVFGRIAKVWQVVLRGSVPPHKLPYFETFVNRVAEQYPS